STRTGAVVAKMARPTIARAIVRTSLGLVKAQKPLMARGLGLWTTKGVFALEPHGMASRDTDRHRHATRTGPLKETSISASSRTGSGISLATIRHCQTTQYRNSN